MKKSVVTLVGIFLVLFFSTSSFACVGKTLTIGALTTPHDQLLAQLIAVIINERTGTTVNVVNFDDREKLYAAVKKREINIFTENTGQALQQLGLEPEGNADAIYTDVKDKYKQQLHLVLLKPFGKSSVDATDSPYVDVPVIAEGILIEYPALPRVINKLARIVKEKSYSRVLAAVESGDKPNQAARDYLKKKRVI